MNRPAVKRFARCIGRDLGRVAVCAWRCVRYYLPFHVRGFFRSIFQKG